MNIIKEKEGKPFIWYFSITIGILLILVKFFRWELVEFLTVFIEPILELILFAIFIVAFIWSFFHLILNTKKNLKPAVITFAINIIVLMAVMFVPFTKIYLDLNFMVNFNQRVQVVNMIESDELQLNTSNHSDIVLLQNQYQHLSKGGGEIFVYKEGDKLTVFFFTFRGILDNFAGFSYVSDDIIITEDFFDNVHEILKKRNNWYWIASS